MALVGFSFSKIFIEKRDITEKSEGKFSINLKDIQRSDVKISEEKEVLKFDFEYDVEYPSRIASISLRGFLLFLLDSAKAEEVLDGWKKSKKIDSIVQAKVYNILFQKCNIKALELEDDLNLPYHLQLPALKMDEAKNEAKKEKK